MWGREPEKTENTQNSIIKHTVNSMLYILSKHTDPVSMSIRIGTHNFLHLSQSRFFKQRPHGIT
jgi:hypothetical protein